MSTPPDQPTVEASAWFRKQLLDQAYQWADRFVLAMRAEGITDDVAARVLDRIADGMPDPGEVTRPDSKASGIGCWPPVGGHDVPDC